MRDSHEYSYGYGRGDYIREVKHISLDAEVKRGCEIWRGQLIMNGIDINKSEAARRLLEIALHKKGYIDDIPTHSEWIWHKLRK